MAHADPDLYPRGYPRRRRSQLIAYSDYERIAVQYLDLQPVRRYSTHLIVLVLVACAVLVSRWGHAPYTPPFRFDGVSDRHAYVPVTSVPLLDTNPYLSKPVIISTFNSASRVVDNAPIVQAQPADRAEVQNYVVQPGEVVGTIARRFGITEDTLVWANDLKDRDSVTVGQRLVIPPVAGVLHTVQAGDTVASIAQRYEADVDKILSYAANGLDASGAIQAGQKIMVPDGKMPPPPPPPTVKPPVALLQSPSAPPAAAAPVVAAAVVAPPPPPPPPVAAVAPPQSGAGYIWPTTGPIFTYFSRGWHDGLDISPPYGTPILAARSGVVVQELKLAWSYGWHLIIDHGDGVQTLYAHVSEFDVSVGDRVSQGQLIAKVGSTGKSTGPHVHFEVHVNGTPMNPLDYLP